MNVCGQLRFYFSLSLSLSLCITWCANGIGLLVPTVGIHYSVMWQWRVETKRSNSIFDSAKIFPKSTENVVSFSYIRKTDMDERKNHYYDMTHKHTLSDLTTIDTLCEFVQFSFFFCGSDTTSTRFLTFCCYMVSNTQCFTYCQLVDFESFCS